ncbi:Aminoglycoside phosphotransferase [[Clostridium] sordellii]|uniref:aminoglycoside phosphotransferase family protein n=1 Tax=Paraclostridium sordellii TaxID=1505 RepID=UPI0005E59C5F|nr:aminoglycoside phosphotransferase family protein [Paeniclostridium sordellii]QYE99348.1 aminoglycoside phosphotransferase family protein [Paeniclostridium sordellii]CEP86963.1 Aminoglycoside phosphotransferase [[Clostridium] sordellii] [Paeniclostridium sordellii]CEP95300.1 Aminoglycoside phosphotransferase [[Clostridium] sordellii] [Paeniclostridium sordellii]
MNISTEIAIKLIKEQFPKYKELKVKPVERNGYDNRTFHLGDDMTIRIPSNSCYVPQVEKESRWLPYLAKNLSLPITTPIEKGKPTNYYPYPWSINKWIDGETVNINNVDLNQFAIDLANFLKELHSIDCSGGPLGGEHNFFRGGDLSVYHKETVSSLDKLKNIIDTEKCMNIWLKATSSKWENKPVWVHGDIASGNLLVKNRKLCGVIDFGILGIGDPSCDLAMAWTFFDEESRHIFIKEMNLDEETLNRARGWVLWKALITYDNEKSKRVIEVLINEDYYKK